jgi:hypothetical protein
MDTLKANIENALKANLEGFDFVRAACDGITMDNAEGRIASMLFDALNNWQDCRRTLIRKVADAHRSAEKMLDHLTATLTRGDYYTSFTPNPENEVKQVAQALANAEEKMNTLLYIVGIEKDDRRKVMEALKDVRK